MLICRLLSSSTHPEKVQNVTVYAFRNLSIMMLEDCRFVLEFILIDVFMNSEDLLREYIATIPDETTFSKQQVWKL